MPEMTPRPAAEKRALADDERFVNGFATRPTARGRSFDPISFTPRKKEDEHA
jgi:hypothetical protein